jgi:hypothetical protein
LHFAARQFVSLGRYLTLVFHLRFWCYEVPFAVLLLAEGAFPQPCSIAR